MGEIAHFDRKLVATELQRLRCHLERNSNKFVFYMCSKMA